MINSTAQESRSHIVSEAAALGLRTNIAILHDRAQLVARAYRPTALPEAVCVSRADWSIFYRGAIDDRVESNSVATIQTYLADALESFLAGEVVSRTQTRPEGCSSPELTEPQVSYASDIALLLQDKCVRCHSPGNIAPWAMTDYDIVHSYAGLIKDQVMTDRMPPWHGDPEYGVFTNDFSLTPEEANKLVKWIDDGSPRGIGADPLTTLAAPTNYPQAWPAELGEPDVLLTFPEEIITNLTGAIPYRYRTMKTDFPSNVWLRAVVVRPSNPRIVHHAGAWLQSNPSDSLSFYNPGQQPWIYPPGTGRLLTRGAAIEMNLHYVPTGKPEKDQPVIGLYLLSAKPPYVIQSDTVGWADEAAGVQPAIPAYKAEDERTAEYTFSDNAWLYQMHPHMHLRGNRMKYEAIYRDGTRETLLSVPMFEGHWQIIYRLAQPKRIPAGTRIKITGAFDNSPQNPDNPAPNRTVNWGLYLTDEMFHGWMHFARTLTLRTQPRTQTIAQGSNATFVSSATTPNPPLTFQWVFNGNEISWATNSLLTLTNIQPTSAGTYFVRVSDRNETLISTNAVLTVTP